MIETRLQIEGDRSGAAPGSTVNVSLGIHSPQPWVVRVAELTLSWHTEGRGDTNECVVHRIELFPPGSDAPASHRRSYPIPVPVLPWTYHGKLIKIRWTVQLAIHARGGKLQLTEQSLLVHPSVALATE